jgi:hypothetical protein
MNNRFKASILGISLFFALSPAFAGTIDDIKAGMQEARESLLAFIAAPDEATRTTTQEGIKSGSAKVDAAVAAADPATAAKLQEFSTIWADFQNTRDTEIIPAVLAGKPDDAKAIAQGIQAERIKRMKEILSAP